MELNKTKNGFYILISVSVMMLLLLGSWWLYLVFKLANKLQDLNHPLLEGNLFSMIKWEGITFFAFLLILTITLLYIYLQDHRKTRSLQGFFSSLTHELKTPLASIKLQTQVLGDIISEIKISDESMAKINKYTRRLMDDSTRLEDQLDNHLQLSRVERKADLNLRPIEIEKFIQKECQRFNLEVPVHIISEAPELEIMADDFALQTILRNLIDNSLKHAKVKDLELTFKISLDSEKGILIEYMDNGQTFDGDIEKLGELFYKHNSPKGSGIGVYLIKKLMKQMDGDVAVSQSKSLKVVLNFLSPENN